MKVRVYMDLDEDTDLQLEILAKEEGRTKKGFLEHLICEEFKKKTIVREVKKECQKKKKLVKNG